MPQPILRRNPDRQSYDLIASVGELCALFDLFGFQHTTLRASDGKIIHRWSHGSGYNKTFLLLFPQRDDHPQRLSILGPLVPEVDGVAIEPVEVQP